MHVHTAFEPSWRHFADPVVLCNKKKIEIMHGKSKAEQTTFFFNRVGPTKYSLMVGQVNSRFSCSKIYFCSIFCTYGKIERESETERDRDREGGETEKMIRGERETERDRG